MDVMTEMPMFDAVGLGIEEYFDPTAAPIETVSPRELMSSCPTSGTLTELTTPGTSHVESPWIADQSPLFDDLDPESVKHWPSLFESALETVETRETETLARFEVAGGTDKKKRNLPKIEVENSTDTVALKRARNTMAARKSRQKRLDHVAQLQDQVTALEAQVAHWKSIAISLGYTEGI